MKERGMPAKEEEQACMESIKSHGRKRNASPPHHPFALLSFFKIMIGDFSQALFLPPIVAKKLSALLDQNVNIEDSNGHRWGVKVSLVDNHLAFEQGWQDFVSDHSIKIGEFVVFNHVDRLLFSAKIYGITGCERLEFVEKSIASKSKGKRKNEASADDLSLKKCQSVKDLDKDVVDSNEGSIKKKRATKSAPGGDTSDSKTATRSRKAGVKRKGEDVNALETSHVRRDSSKRPQIEIVEPVATQDGMDDKTCQISPSGPVNMDVDVMTMTNSDNSNNVGGSISEGMSRDFFTEEQMPDVKLVEIPVKVTSRYSVFMKGNFTVSEAKGKSCNAVETDTFVTNEKSSHGSLNETEADTLVVNEELSPHHRLSAVKCQSLLTSEFDGHGSQNKNVIVDPLISDKVITEDLPEGTSTAEGIKINLEGGETDSSESFDHDVTEGNLNASDGVVYKFLGTLHGICYIVKEDFADQFGDGIVNPIDLCDADEADFLRKTDGTFNEDESRHISHPVPLDKVPQNEDELGSFGKMPVVSPEENEKLNVRTDCLMIGKKPDELLEENEKKSSLSPEVTVHEDSKPEYMDLVELPSSDSLICKFHLPSNNSWLKLPNGIPHNFGKMFISRKVLVLQDPVMRMWPVLYCESRRFTGFIGGWKDFTAANDLKEGDMCELYLADKKNNTFLVRVTKAENPSP